MVSNKLLMTTLTEIILFTVALNDIFVYAYF